MIKCDFHMHSREDPMDVLEHSAYDLINHASSLGYQALSLTLHGKCHFPAPLEAYAHSKGILLIPGIELYIEHREVLVLGGNEVEMHSLRTFADLAKLKKKRGKDLLVIAPHPFYGLGQCVGDKLEAYSDVFDAIELCHFYTTWWNPNLKGEQMARKIQKPMIACSDTHRLRWMKNHYTLVDAPLSRLEIFEAVRDGRIQNITRPLTLKEMTNRLRWHAFVQHPLKLARKYGLLNPSRRQMGSPHPIQMSGDS